MAELDSPTPPNPLTIGGRLRAERERLRLSMHDASQLMGMTEKALGEMEGSTASGQFASALKLGAMAGYDVLFIVTGIRNEVGRADGRTAGDRVRHALAELPSDERARLLLHLTAEELRYWLSRR